MPEPDDLQRQLRALTTRLDDDSRPVDPDAAMDRSAPSQPMPWRPIIAVAAAVVLIAGVVVTTRSSDDGADLHVTATQPTTSSSTPTEGGDPSYSGVPYEDLPDAGIAVTQGLNEETTLRLLAFDGTELAIAKTFVAREMGATPDRRAVAVRVGAFELADPDPAQAPEGCDEAAGGGGLRVALCGGEWQLRSEIVTVSPAGTTTKLIGAAPDSHGHGHWRWALPSRDGRWVLAQWSGECEVPIAFFISADGRQVRSVDGSPGLGGLNSSGIGWAPDGRAVVQFDEAACGTGIDKPGIYLVDPDSGDKTLVHAQRGPETTLLWKRQANVNEAETVIQRALAELRLDSCCGEPSHGGDGATTGARWKGSDVPIRAISADDPPFVPFNDLVLSSRADQIKGVPVTVGEADLGSFVALTCGGRVWSIGGAGAGDRTTDELVRTLAVVLIPHLYCTAGPRPAATGHGVP